MTLLLTYAEFGAVSEELAAELNAAGVGRGDPVGVRVKSGTLDLATVGWDDDGLNAGAGMVVAVRSGGSDDATLRLDPRVVVLDSLRDLRMADLDHA